MTSSHFRFVGLFVLGLVLCLGLTGCGSKVSKANCDKITKDMTEAQVKEILGAPTETSNHGATLLWKSGNDTISCTFNNGKMIVKVSSFDLKDAMGVK
jgi:hypothetical protein